MLHGGTPSLSGIDSFARRVAMAPREPKPRPCRRCKHPFMPSDVQQRICTACVEARARKLLEEHEAKWAPRPCTECGQRFTPKAVGALYCGKPCSKAATLRRNRERERERQKAKPPAPMVQCPICQKPFPKRRGRSACSPPCSDEHRRRQIASEIAEGDGKLLSVALLGQGQQIRVHLKVWHSGQRGIEVRLFSWRERQWEPSNDCIKLQFWDSPERLRQALSAALSAVQMEDEAEAEDDADEEAQPAHL